MINENNEIEIPNYWKLKWLLNMKYLILVPITLLATGQSQFDIVLDY